MTQIIIIAAVAQNGVIGSKNAIPWRISEDFKHFKNLTMGHPCIMGDKTYLSLPEQARPLPGRENIVLTFDEAFHPEGTTVFRDFDEAVAYARTRDPEKAFITGGATIYKLGLNVADILELTRVHREYEGEIRFPDFDPNAWELVNKEDGEGMDTVNGIPVSFSYETYKRVVGM